ncbi:MAG: hemolysin family protein [Ferruginibacter sp.]
MDISALLAIFFASLLLIGFFAGVERAFISTNKLSIELNKKQGTYSGRTWGRYAENPTRFIGTILIGINIVLVIYGLLVGAMLLPIWTWIESLIPPAAANYVKYIKLLVETILASFIVLVIIVACRAFFKAKHSLVVNSGFIAFITSVFYSLFSSLSSLFVSISEWILKYVLNVKLTDHQHEIRRVDLEHFIQQSGSNKEDDHSDLNKELFENALALSNVKLRDCLVPRKEIISIDKHANLQKLKDLFIETRLSKLIVYDGNIDTIVGYIHQLDLFNNPVTLQEMILPISVVPETMSATDMMDKFSRERKSIAWVIDEYGGTAGIITMEDLLEELFGEIKDEYDEVDEYIDKQIATNEYIFSGRLELDYIENKYRLIFPDNDGAETLSGYIISQHEGIPRSKQRILTNHFVFDILNVSDTRIETVKVKLLK